MHLVLVLYAVYCHTVCKTIEGTRFGCSYIFYSLFVEKIELFLDSGFYSCENDGSFVNVTIRVAVTRVRGCLASIE